MTDMTIGKVADVVGVGVETIRFYERRKLNQGVLMRTGEAFQALRKVNKVVFDKTGTLTEGRPAVRSLYSVNGNDDALAAAVEVASEHPLGRAVVEAALERNIDFPEIADFCLVLPSLVDFSYKPSGQLPFC